MPSLGPAPSLLECCAGLCRTIRLRRDVAPFSEFYATQSGELTRLRRLARGWGWPRAEVLILAGFLVAEACHGAPYKTCVSNRTSRSVSLDELPAVIAWERSQQCTRQSLAMRLAAIQVGSTLGLVTTVTIRMIVFYMIFRRQTAVHFSWRAMRLPRAGRRCRIFAVSLNDVPCAPYVAQEVSA